MIKSVLCGVAGAAASSCLALSASAGTVTQSGTVSLNGDKDFFISIDNNPDNSGSASRSVNTAFVERPVLDGFDTSQGDLTRVVFGIESLSATVRTTETGDSCQETATTPCSVDTKGFVNYTFALDLDVFTDTIANIPGSGVSIGQEITRSVSDTQGGASNSISASNVFKSYTSDDVLALFEDSGPIQLEASALLSYSIGLECTWSTIFDSRRDCDGGLNAQVSSSNLKWSLTYEFEDKTGPAPVPLPAALPLLLAGLGGVAVAGRRRRG